MSEEEQDPVTARVQRLQREFAGQVLVMKPEEKRSRGITDDSPRTWAIEQVARERGVTSNRIRQIIRDAFKRQKRQEKLRRDFAARKIVKLEDFDLELDADWLSGVEYIQDEMHMAAWHLGQAARVVKVLKRSEWYPDSEAKRLEEALKQARIALHAALPGSVCPYCKQTSGVIEECAACFGLGLIMQHQMEDVPKQFWAVQQPLVLHRGEEKPRIAFEPELEQQEMFEE